jgi:hypothetical protein
LWRSFFATVPWSSRASEGEAPGRDLRDAGGLEATRRPMPDPEPDLDGMPERLPIPGPIPGRAGFAGSSAGGFAFPIGARAGFAAGFSTAFEFVVGLAFAVFAFELAFAAGFGATLFVRAAGAAGVRPTVRIVVLAAEALLLFVDAPPPAACAFGAEPGEAAVFGIAVGAAPEAR